MRIIENFNQNWLFNPAKIDLQAGNEHFTKVNLPHSNQYFGQRFVDNQQYQFISTYRKQFTVVDDLTAKQVWLDFAGVMLEATVYVNGRLLGVHQGGYTPFSFDITADLVVGENTLTVYVDSRERADIPPYGALVDFLTFGGIYRDVNLRIVPVEHIQSVFVKTSHVLTTPRLQADVQLSQAGRGFQLETLFEDAAGNVLARQMQLVTTQTVTMAIDELPPIELWSLEHPCLYYLRCNLWSGETLLDQETVRFGFREAEFRADGKFYLNGTALKLFGLNRHQTYPYLGAAAPVRLQALDADILKYELGCNVVRTSHYPQSPHFLNRCDEIGLLVFEELAGWQHIGAEAWQKLILQDLQAMLERDRHHPAIILWGVRINESPDHHTLYTETNALAHQIDPTRPTGGVRNFITSEFLEDVFTLNDFPEGIQNPLVRPHLITECVGHMFPTKTWDHEERRVQHALRHVVKHSLQMGHPDVAGAIGWCAFDYHTHQQFGSGDRICHHGVMDMFRLPKWAAYFYRSQKAPTEEIVLQAATHWTMGDRSGGGNQPLTIFSNCEEIEVFIGEASQGCFRPNDAEYPHLQHPPFTIRWAEPYNPWGTAFEDLTLRGYIKGACVAEQRIAADGIPQKLCLTTHTPKLKADGADMARLAVQIVDRYDNVLPYQVRVVTFTIEGDAELIGENPLALIGGQAAVYLKSRQTSGKIKVSAQVPDLPAAVIEMIIEA